METCETAEENRTQLMNVVKIKRKFSLPVRTANSNSATNQSELETARETITRVPGAKNKKCARAYVNSLLVVLLFIIG